MWTLGCRKSAYQVAVSGFTEAALGEVPSNAVGVDVNAARNLESVW